MPLTVAALALSVVVVGIHVGIRREHLTCVGYNYGSVILRGEWWRLVAAPLCHGDREHCAVTVAGLLYVAQQPQTEWRFATLSVVMALAAEVLTLATVGGLVAAGAPAQEFSADEAFSDRWLAHGSGVVAMAWISEPIVALLFSFCFLLTAPDEPASPLVVAYVVGRLLSRVDLDPTALFPWLAFFALASLKATTGRVFFLIDYSNLPSAASSATSPRGDDDDDDQAYGPDGAPVFRIRLDPPQSSSRRRSDGENGAARTIDARDLLFPEETHVGRFGFPPPPPPRWHVPQQQDPFFQQDDDEESLLRRHLLRGDPDDFPSTY